MKQLILLIAMIGLGSISNAQTDSLHLTNALVVSHMDNQEDRYSLEVAISEILSANQVKNAVSLNVLKQGGDPQVLMTDSLTQILAGKGINTMMLVSIRGYDKRFRRSEKKLTLAEDLSSANLFSLYKDDIVSVTLEFHFYRNGVLVGSDLLKIGAISSREGVMKKLRKKLPKRIRKHWK
ncbi:MAG: hypothetical protein QE487_02715 [Fluviicola sp.]|nr:hypothetical protein [Fluviicola sp.]